MQITVSHKGRAGVVDMDDALFEHMVKGVANIDALAKFIGRLAVPAVMVVSEEARALVK